MKKDKVVSIDYVKIKLYSKLSAIEQINKMMGYNEPEKLDHNVKGVKAIISFGGKEIEI